jgi:hypothetical protein
MSDEIEKILNEAMAEVLPFESWERLPAESARAYGAFCIYRDFGPERTIRKAVNQSCKDHAPQSRRCRLWANWSSEFKWRQRAADYDQYIDKLKQMELRKTIEAQGERHRAVTGKMLLVVEKKLDLMNPAELSQVNVTEWVETAIRAEREAAGLVGTNGGKVEPKQGEFVFTQEFNGV